MRLCNSLLLNWILLHHLFLRCSTFKISGQDIWLLGDTIIDSNTEFEIITI